MNGARPSDVDSYIAAAPKTHQKLLTQLRTIVRKAAPAAEECISYGMPAYRDLGVLVYFAAFKAHIGFYPTSSAITAFEQELSAYKWAKGSVQFPLDRPLPVTLITKMVKFRVNETRTKARQKR